VRVPASTDDRIAPTRPQITEPAVLAIDDISRISRRVTSWFPDVEVLTAVSRPLGGRIELLLVIQRPDRLQRILVNLPRIDPADFEDALRASVRASLA
jgi:hypothetical protein